MVGCRLVPARLLLLLLTKPLPMSILFADGSALSKGGFFDCRTEAVLFETLVFLVFPFALVAGEIHPKFLQNIFIGQRGDDGIMPSPASWRNRC